MKPEQILTKYTESFNFTQLRKKRQANQLKLLSNLRRGEQNISTTLMITLFNRIMANTYDNKMQVKFLPSQGITQDQIDSYDILAESDYLEMGKAKLDYDWTWDTLFFGRGYMETGRFDMKRKIMQPHVINPLVFGYDPYIENPQDWRYYWKWITKSKYDLLLLQKAGILEDFNIKTLPSGIEPYLWQYKIIRDQARDAVAPPIDPVDNDVFQILEFYGLSETGDKCVYWVDKNFSTILYQKELDFDDGDEVVVPDGETVRRSSNWPIVVKESFRVPHSSVPISVADLLEDKHRAKSVLLNLAYVAAKDQANPLYWYDPDKVKDAAQFLSRQINQHIPVEGNGEDAVGPINKASTMSPELTNFISMITQEANEPLGTGQASNPKPNKPDTATGQSIDQQLNDIAQSLTSKVMQFGEQEFYSQWFHRYAKHADDLDFKMANIVGVNGVNSHVIDLSKFNTDFPPGVMVYSAKEAEYKNLVKRRDYMQLYPNLAQTLDPDGMRNFNKHVFFPLFLEDPSLVDIMFPKTLDEIKAEAENEQLKDDMMADVAPTDNHTTHIYTHMMVSPKTWATWAHIHWHQELLAQQTAQAQKQGGGPGGQQNGQNKVSESISYKDLPPEGQQQMAQQAGINIGLPSPQSPVDNQPGGAQTGSKLKKPNQNSQKQSPLAQASPLKTEIASNNQSNIQ